MWWHRQRLVCLTEEEYRSLMAREEDQHRDPGKFFLTLGVVRPKPHPGIRHVGEPIMAFQIHDFEQVTIKAAATDAEGNPADATIAFASSDPSIVAVTDNGDGSALLVASPGEGGLGTATVTATVTNNDDGTVLEGTLDVEVIAGDAVAVNFEVGTPEAKAPVAPPEPPIV